MSRTPAATLAVRSWIAPLAVAVLALAAHAAWYGHIADDAYISFRYARLLSQGHGAVFNVGERVMGYSNPLWTLLLAVGEALGVGGEQLAPVLGLLASSALLVALAGWGQRNLNSTVSLWLLVLLPALCGSFALWSGAGLEGPLFGLLLGVAALRLHEAGPAPSARSLWGNGLLIALAVWTRPEGALFAAALAAAQLTRSRSWPVRRRTAWLLAAPALAYVVQLVMIWSYYGDPVPNTWFAKAQPPSLQLWLRGGRFALRFASLYAYIPPIVLVAWLGLRGWRRDGAGRYTAWMILAFVAFFVSIGGDALVLFRMWAWTLPWFAVLGAEALDEALQRGLSRPIAAGGVAVVLLALAWPSAASRQLDYLRLDEQVVDSGRRLGDRLSQLPPDTLIAANTIGALAYRSELPVVDMLGLTDAHIAKVRPKAWGVPAHESHDGAYVLDRHPDLIVFGVPFLRPQALSATQLGLTAQYPSDRDLLNDPRLLRDYRALGIAVDARWATVWARKGWLAAHPEIASSLVAPRAGLLAR